MGRNTSAYTSASRMPTPNTVLAVRNRLSSASRSAAIWAAYSARRRAARALLEVEEREVLFDEVKDFAECGLCGTAAVISPVGKIVDHGKEICLPSGMDEMGPVTKKLYETLTGIQMGRIEAPKGWIYTVD